VPRLHRLGLPLPPGDAECGKTPLVLDPLGFLDRRDLDICGIHALREIP
jgi:hypothetical protein